MLEIVGKSPVISEYEKLIRADLESRGLTYDTATARVLVRHLAGTQLLLKLEQVYSLIFGSQIQLLKRLNEVAGRGRDEDYVVDFIDEAMLRDPKIFERWTHEDYLHFLVTNSLVTIQDKSLHITGLGVEFLTWMTRTGRNENRIL